MTQADQYEIYMLGLINAERAKVGADPLKLELNLNAASEQHSKWMLQENIFSHTGIGGSSATQRMSDAGFDFSGSWRSAENIAVQSERGSAGIMDDVQNLHTSLMNSPGHRANILNPALDYVGIGIETGNFSYSSGAYQSVIVTQNFAATGGNVELDAGAVDDDTPAPAIGSEGEVLRGTAAADILEGGEGNDTMNGGKGNDLLRGGDADDLMRGAGGNDRLLGENGDDRLFGGNGDDKLFGGDGRDLLRGGGGRDTLDGGAGNDLLLGGNGSDTFVFAPGYDLDRIRDFQAGIDQIDLSSFGLASEQQAFAFADQRGDKVVFNFGDGDRLVVENTVMDDMTNDFVL